MLILDPATKKALWKKKLQEFMELSNKINNRKKIIVDMGKEVNQWENDLNKEFSTFCCEVLGKEESNLFEVMKVLND